MRRSERIQAAVLAVRMLPWALAMPVLKHRVPVRRLAELLGAESARPRDPARERAIARASWWTSRLAQPRRFPDNCLERSLVAYRFLARSGADPRLELGLRGDGDNISGHAWVTVDGVPVHDRPHEIDRYERIIELTTARWTRWPPRRSGSWRRW